MKKKNKYTGFTDFLRYRKGEMTNAEKNSFEKELEKDPFLSEAFAGLGSVNDTHIENDLISINKKLRRRTERKRRFIIYRIAASIAVLMIVSSVFIVIERNSQESREAMPEYKSVTMDIPRPEPLRKPEESPAAALPTPPAPTPPKSNQSSSEPSRKAAKEQVSYNMVREEREIQREDVEPSKKMEAVQEQKIPDSNRFLAEGAAGNQPAAAARSVISRDISQADTPARPAGGQQAFDRYILENIRRPDSATAGQRVVVVTSFRVKTDGSLDSIKIVKSPQKQFSDEAIRLIKEGPAWRPAIRDGVAVEDEVSLRIVFP